MRIVVAAFLVMGSASLFAQSEKLMSAQVLAGTSAAPQVRTPNPSGPATYRGKTLAAYLSEASDPALRVEVLRALGNFRASAAPAIPQLIEGLNDKNVEARIAAAWSLSQIGPALNVLAVRALGQSLSSDSDPKVRSLAAVALREAGRGAVEAVPALIVGLQDSASYVRAPSADALGAIGAPARDAVEPLMARLRISDEPSFVLRSTATALGKIGPDARSAIPALIEVRKLNRITYAAEEAIHRINGESVPTYW